MKTMQSILFLCLTLFLLPLIHLPSTAASAPVTIYQNYDYLGTSQDLNIGTYNTNQISIGNDQVSSIKVAPGYKVTLYSNADFSGETRVLFSDFANLSKIDFNDKTSSIKVEYDPDWTPAVTIYQNYDFEGEKMQFGVGKFNYTEHFQFLNDAISSLKIKAGYKITLFADANYQGKSIVLTGDEPNLSEYSMNDTISSFIIEKTNPVDNTALQVKDLNDDAEKARLLQLFAPRIFMDANEKYMPSSIEYNEKFVNRVFNDQNQKPMYTTKETIKEPDTKLDYFKGDLSTAKIYSFWVDRGEYVDLTYYEFSPYNWGKRIFGTEYGDHVGDWEHVTVRLYKITANGTNYVKPDLVLMSYHAWMGKSSFKTMEIVNGTHPVIYCANGSHGMYKTTGEHIYKNFVVVVLSDLTSKGQQWDTWNSLVTLEYNQGTKIGKGLGTSTWPIQFAQKEDYSMESGAVYQWGNNKIPGRKGPFGIEDEFGGGPTSPIHQFDRDL